MIDWKSNNLDAYLWDVGHGLSMTFISPYVESAEGVDIKRRRIIQVDVGTNPEKNFYPIKHLVENRGLSIIDYLVISHPDQDHINDLANIDDLRDKKKLEIIRFRRNNTIQNSIVSEDVRNECQAKKVYKEMNNTFIHPFGAHHDVNPNTFAGLWIKTDHIDHEDDMDINDASVVTNILFKNTQFLIPGDLSEVGFNKMVELGKAPCVYNNVIRILVAPHHGRESAEADYLVNYYKPHIVLASAKEGDEHTDKMYSQSKNISGYHVANDDNSSTSYKFLATKGKLIGIKVADNYPIIKKVSYDK